jgi:hypothetical protein
MSSRDKLDNWREDGLMSGRKIGYMSCMEDWCVETYSFKAYGGGNFFAEFDS